MSETLLLMVMLILVFLLILASVFVYLLVQRKKEFEFEKKLRAYKEQTRTAWFDYLIEGKTLEDKLIPKTKFDMQAADEVLIRYAKSTSDQFIVHQIMLFTQNYLEDYYRKQLQSKSWSVRMNTLHKISDFQMRFLMDDVVTMMESEHDYSAEEYLQMYKLFSLFLPKYFLQLLLERQHPFGEFEYKKLLVEFELEQLELLIERFDQVSPKLQYIILDVIGVRKYVSCIHFLEQQLNNKDVEVRIRALKSIAEIGFISKISLYTPFIASSSWEERLMVAKVLLHAPMEESVKYLESLMSDEVWWVRLQAAQTLRSHKTGIKTLEAVVQTSNDQFAIDMAKEMLGRE